ncbi:hypothetical protein SAMN05216197_101360 [Pseudomonas graminis]|uniref:Uncharacterized protein n=1 Tax=Pseudomonas graminis TaxID=158627 RepID=A0A1H9YPI1_9PSED|nr:hypothetical protein SAMN05216197_101360 [Pseudomonas graminis]
MYGGVGGSEVQDAGSRNIAILNNINSNLICWQIFEFPAF